MSTCNGCGGVVGRDCFNPQECEWISHDMQQRTQYSVEQMVDKIRSLWAEVGRLKSQVAALTPAAANPESEE